MRQDRVALFRVNNAFDEQIDGRETARRRTIGRLGTVLLCKTM